ncbi:DNA polymerase IV [Thermorudis peleae]|uniref:DNA polymerase IV n=1 Tax=Thermorudis peleae TaxID=1382356 RepID=UPI00068B78FF|nr:DNA polymerase IV [Thermorudis peleae]
MGGLQRAVVHADLDAFFAAAEVRRRPELRGTPVIVAGRPEGRSVVSSATYEARRFGVHSGMSLGEALARCPNAVVLPVDGAYYRTLADAFRAIIFRLSSVVEVLSIDEACFEVGVQENWMRELWELGQRLRQAVRDELGLTVTVGAGANRTVAKIAADHAKPDGLLVVPQGAEARFLAPLPVEAMPGIGPRTAAELRGYGIRRLGDLASAPISVLRLVFGRRCEEMRERARGIDRQPIRPEPREPKSIGQERTFARDLFAPKELADATAQLAAAVTRRARAEGYQAQTVSVKVRFRDFTTLTRQRRLDTPTADEATVAAVAYALIERLVRDERRPVRLLGVRLSGLRPLAVQLALFDTQTARRLLALHALDRLAARWGERPVHVPPSVLAHSLLRPAEPPRPPWLEG